MSEHGVQTTYKQRVAQWNQMILDHTSKILLLKIYNTAREFVAEYSQDPNTVNKKVMGTWHEEFHCVPINIKRIVLAVYKGFMTRRSN